MFFLKKAIKSKNHKRLQENYQIDYKQILTFYSRTDKVFQLIHLGF